MNGLITVVEAAGGIMSGSLSLLSDAVHNLGDTAAILLSYVAWKIAGKDDANESEIAAMMEALAIQDFGSQDMFT